MEPILGLDLVYAILQSAKKGRFLESLVQRHRTHGRTFQTTSFGKTIINTVDPKILSTVFATASDNFGVALIREPPAKRLVGRGVFTTDGTEWAHSRGLIRPCFARAQVTDLTLLKVHVDQLLELIPGDGSTIDLQALFCRLVSLWAYSSNLVYTADSLTCGSLLTALPNSCSASPWTPSKLPIQLKRKIFLDLLISLNTAWARGYA